MRNEKRVIHHHREKVKLSNTCVQRCKKEKKSRKKHDHDQIKVDC